LDADRRTDKEERKADKEEWKANRKTAKEEILKKMDEYQPKTDAVLLAMQVMETSHREMVDEATPERNMETMACRETMEAHLQEEGTMACQEVEARIEEKEPTSVDRKPEVAQQREVPKEDTVVQPVKGRKRRLRGKKQAAG
jgi:hypothetical protein